MVTIPYSYYIHGTLLIIDKYIAFIFILESKHYFLFYYVINEKKDQQKAININLHCVSPNHQQPQTHQNNLKSHQNALELLTRPRNMWFHYVGLILTDGFVIYPRRK